MITRTRIMFRSYKNIYFSKALREHVFRFKVLGKDFRVVPSFLV